MSTLCASKASVAPGGVSISLKEERVAVSDPTDDVRPVSSSEPVDEKARARLGKEATRCLLARESLWELQ